MLQVRHGVRVDRRELPVVADVGALRPFGVLELGEVHVVLAVPHVDVLQALPLVLEVPGHAHRVGGADEVPVLPGEVRALPVAPLAGVVVERLALPVHDPVQAVQGEDVAGCHDATHLEGVHDLAWRVAVLVRVQRLLGVQADDLVDPRDPAQAVGREEPVVLHAVVLATRADLHAILQPPVGVVGVGVVVAGVGSLTSSGAQAAAQAVVVLDGRGGVPDAERLLHHHLARQHAHVVVAGRRRRRLGRRDGGRDVRDLLGARAGAAGEQEQGGEESYKEALHGARSSSGRDDSVSRP